MKLKYKKKEKSAKGNLKAKEACHWYHDTLSDARTKKKPFKRFRYLFFPFQITFKVLKVPLNGFCCNMNLEHTHNHQINSLEALSFRMLIKEVKNEMSLCFPLV